MGEVPPRLRFTLLKFNREREQQKKSFGTTVFVCGQRLLLRPCLRAYEYPTFQVRLKPMLGCNELLQSQRGFRLSGRVKLEGSTYALPEFDSIRTLIKVIVSKIFFGGLFLDFFD